jgi:hypothetical protein
MAPDSKHRSVGARAWAFALVALLGLMACGGRSHAGDPIPECDAFERAFATCTGGTVAEATHTASLNAVGDERDRLRDRCAADLQRIRQACR